MAVKPIPDGYNSVIPYLIIDGAADVIEFATRAFDARQRGDRMEMPNGKIGHAELQIGDSMIMLADAPGGDEGQPMPATLHVYVEDVDKVYRQALEAGGVSVQEPTDQFYGDRMAGVRDPAGDRWWIATHIEDVPPEEMAKRAQEWAAKRS